MNEVIHFTDNGNSYIAEAGMDNAYGATYAAVVNEYLRSEYSGEAAQSEVEAFGKTYKILKRENATAFYDEAGNTLFDVTNDRLKKEYDFLMKHREAPAQEDSNDKEAGGAEYVQMGTASLADAVTGNVPAPTKEEIKEAEKKMNEQPEETPTADTDSEPQKAGADEAVAKLQEELKKDKDKSFAEPVIAYLIERCKESESLAADICQQHKTWEKCRDYIYSLARKQATGNYAAVRDEVVYEWSEDYYHLDDKAAEEKKAKEEAERKKKAAEREKKAKEREQLASQKAGTYKQKTETKRQEKKEPAPKQDKPKKSSKDMDGQLDLFSMMGM